MCTAKFLSPAFDEGDHGDNVGNKANLTNVDVNRQSTKISKRDLHQRDYLTDIDVFFHHETVLLNPREDRHDKDSSIPTSAPESSHTSLVQQARETRLEHSLVYDGTLILTEIVVCVVWYKEVSSTQLAVSSQQGLLSIFPFRPSW